MEARAFDISIKKEWVSLGIWGTNSFWSAEINIDICPVLVLLNFQKEFTVKCDASGRGIGAVLIGVAVAYFSKALLYKNLAKSTYEKELMALVLAIQ